jgi:hypothetical protein
MKRALTLMFVAGFITAVLFAVTHFAGSRGTQQPRPLYLPNSTGFTQFDSVLEKYNAYVWSDQYQGYVIQPDPAKRIINPNPNCTWDINDHLDRQANNGYLDPGQSSSVGQCMINDQNPIYHDDGGGSRWWGGASNWYGARILSSSAGLSVTVCYSIQGRCFTLTPVYSAADRGYNYRLCVQAVYNPADPALYVIPGSTPDPVPDGASPGWGVQTTVTLTVTNPTGRQVKGIVAFWGVSGDVSFPQGCPGLNGDGGTNPNSVTVSKQVAYPFRWLP